MPGNNDPYTENLVYSSSRIHERRQRIIDVTLELVSEFGHDGFNIRDLCRRAEVAPQTVYKAFGSKEHLVAIAIKQYFMQWAKTQTFVFEGSTIEGVIERLAISDINIRKLRGFGSALIAIFVSQTVLSDISNAAHYHTSNTLQPWLLALRQKGYIKKGLSHDRLSLVLEHLLICVAQDWVCGKISDDEFLPKKLQHLLTYALGASRGAGQEEINLYLEDTLSSFDLVCQVLKKSGIQDSFEISH